jgi:hypothetical protein
VSGSVGVSDEREAASVGVSGSVSDGREADSVGVSDESDSRGRCERVPRAASMVW